MDSRTYYYARVSTKEQNEDRKRLAMYEFGIADRELYMDKQSGKDFERPNYKKLIRKLKPGDALVIKSIDRLGRNYEEILEQWRIITREKKAAIVVLDTRQRRGQDARSSTTHIYQVGQRTNLKN